MASRPEDIARLIPPEGRNALFLDYDGTLVPFHDEPFMALPGPELLQLLDRVTATPRREVVIVSGRTADDLRRLLPAPAGWHLLALHGAQYVDPGGRVVDRVDLGACRAGVLTVAEECRAILASAPGARLENKEAGLSLHTRACDPVTERRVIRQFLEIAGRATSGGALSVLRGARVVELKPAAADKGSAVLWLLQWFGPSCYPVYVGDDATDEDAFRVLRDRGATVLVGPPGQETLARHRLEDPRAVRDLLELIAASPAPVG